MPTVSVSLASRSVFFLRPWWFRARAAAQVHKVAHVPVLSPPGEHQARVPRRREPGGRPLLLAESEMYISAIVAASLTQPLPRLPCLM